MLYIVEAPLHFGLILVPCILAFIFVLGALVAVKQYLAVERFFIPFSIILEVAFVFLTFLVLALSIALLPASATIEQLLPYYQWVWALFGVHAFFGLYFIIYSNYWKILEEKLWINIPPILGTLSFLILVVLLPNTLTAVIVSDGILNYVAMPLTLVVYGGLLALFYMFLIPIYVIVFVVSKTWDDSMRIWGWLTLLSTILWFITSILVALVQYTAPYMLWIFGLAAITWIIFFVSFVKYDNALMQKIASMKEPVTN